MENRIAEHGDLGITIFLDLGGVPRSAGTEFLGARCGNKPPDHFHCNSDPGTRVLWHFRGSMDARLRVAWHIENQGNCFGALLPPFDSRIRNAAWLLGYY